MAELTALPDPSTIMYALLGGILPALVWLTFWLHEDSKKPEPRGFIMTTFILGMITVVLVVPFQFVAKEVLGIHGPLNLENLTGPVLFSLLFVWAALEECIKFVAAYFGGLKTPEDDEPIDPVIYMITAALGFAALENTFFIFEPLSNSNLLSGIYQGNMRFIGPTLLHVISSAIIGVSLSFSFYKSRAKKVLWVLGGVILAVATHTMFNELMLAPDKFNPAATFGLVWVAVIILLLTFEKIKTIRPRVTDNPLSPEVEK
jgi:RsiW-degrading membrane proteinase PrsW (M82 family)